MRMKVLSATLSLLCLFSSYTFPTHVSTQAIKQQMRSPNQEQARLAKIASAKRMSAAVRKMRTSLLAKKVPFEPAILFSRNWRTRIAPYLAQMPEMRQQKTLSRQVGGVKIADTLVLPDKVELTGDTVILARNLIFGGKNIEIKGHYDLLVFPIEHVLSANDSPVSRGGKGFASFTKANFASAKSIEDARQRGLLAQPERITINVDGLGGEQWLEKQRESKKILSHHPGLNQEQNIDMPPGATGRTGDPGEPGQTPNQADTGASGNCASGPDGWVGHTGMPASTAGTGLEGGRGMDGADGGILRWEITGTTGFFNLSARGGRGGQGGQGGPGGFAARGGQGGQGGAGAVCPCPAPSGNGGRGGQGGPGGQGGDGGPGGQGATGGKGGIINLTMPCDYVPTYATAVNRGGPGPGGEPGALSIGGPGGFGGPGGKGGSNIGCLSQGGGNGLTASDGPPGEPGNFHGVRGPDGQPGPEDGQVNVTTTGNCGGGGDGEALLEPGGPTEYCTNWYWVYYHCEYYYSRSHRAGHNYGFLSHHKMGPSLLDGWECVEMGREWAGCW